MSGWLQEEGRSPRWPPSPGTADSNERVRPLRQWSLARQETVRSRLAALHRAWCADWLPSRAAGVVARDVDVRIRDADAIPVGQASWSFVPAASTLPGDSAGSAIEAIAVEMFGIGRSRGALREAQAVASDVARAGWSDWLQRFATLTVALPPEPRPSREASAEASVQAGVGCTPWSGALCAVWSWCGGLWRLELSHEAVVALLGMDAQQKLSSPHADPPPKTRLDEALAHELITLRVGLAGTELNLGQLQALRLGDVVPLAHRLDAPALVRTFDDIPMCNGWLGQLDGRVAIELALTPEPPPNTQSEKEENR